MWRATQDFNLTRRGFADEDSETGLWDGEKILLTVGRSV
jgi:prenylcysteine oxidase/farnesylcysteine lyase